MIERVSIHAPAWGATRLAQIAAMRTVVSIHAPAWGATCNNRPPGRRRKVVSIHAPAWGATGSKKALAGVDRGFNPRARMGRDCPPSIKSKTRQLHIAYREPAQMGRSGPHHIVRSEQVGCLFSCT